MPKHDDLALELKQLDAAVEEGKILAARESLTDFCEYVMVDGLGKSWKIAGHQREWANILRDRQNRRVLIAAPRNSSKSTFVQAFVLNEIGLNPNILIKYVCGNDQKAIDRLRFIRKNIVENARYRRVFPHIEPEETLTEWSKHKAFVKRPAAIGLQDATIECSSVTAGGTGGRADLLVLDDIIDATDALSRPGVMAQIKRFVEEDWMKTLNPGGRAVMIGTFWSWDPPDIYVEYKERKEWKVWTKPACDMDANGNLIGPFLWPERWGKQELEEARGDGEDSFQQQYLLRGAVQRSDFFSQEHIAACKSHSFRLGEVPEGIEIVRVGIGLDPATALTTKIGSFACIYVAGLDRVGRKIPLAIIRLKADPEILCDGVIQQWLHWNSHLGVPITILVENNGTQRTFETLIRIIGERHGFTSLPIKGQFTGQAKWNAEAGLPARNAELAQGKWLIPFGGDHKEAFHDCPVCQWINEMLFWGKMRDAKGHRPTTDIIMAWWLASCALDQGQGFTSMPMIVERDSLQIRYGSKRVA